MVETKQCSKCKEVKELSQFYKNNKTKDGLTYYCKSCCDNNTKEYRKTERGREATNRYFKTDKGKKTLKRGLAKYFKTARGKAKLKESSNRRRAQKLQSEGIYTQQDILSHGEFQGWLCWWCGKFCKDDYHEDHYIPLSKGGSNWPSNIVISCPRCNHKKNKKLPDEFIQYIKDHPDEFK